MHRAYLESRPEFDPGDVIANQRVKELYYKFLGAVCGIHDEVILKTSQTESRILFRNTLLCRVVPYRDLFHVQIGEKDTWEIRVKDEACCVDTLDRVLARFLDVYASRERR
ncbi:MAG: hypothetical protein JSW58_09470 [Candidatus Latescibacterota bacterium]|nr:MAG: hypothetical protein JSW58_09470 [Candidatus Latescibacterota bacterium]